jgi:hypothetical protein
MIQHERIAHLKDALDRQIDCLAIAIGATVVCESQRVAAFRSVNDKKRLVVALDFRREKPRVRVQIELAQLAWQ